MHRIPPPRSSRPQHCATANVQWTPCNGHHATDAMQRTPCNRTKCCTCITADDRQQAATHPRRHLRPDYRGHCAHVHRLRAGLRELARKTALCFPTQRHRCGDPAVRGMACSWRHCGDGQRSTSPDSGFTVGDGGVLPVGIWAMLALARLVSRCAAGRADQGAGSVLLDQRFRPRYADCHLLKARPIATY